MINLYTYGSSNGRRVSVMLEECGLPYRTHVVDLAKGEQRDPAYLAINPAGQIPAIVDGDGPGGAPITVTQSGAILLYLAAKTGKLMPGDADERIRAVEWVFHAVTDCAGASGSIYALSARVPERSEANVRYYEDRLLAHFRIADAALGRHAFLAGATFSIARAPVDILAMLFESSNEMIDPPNPSTTENAISEPMSCPLTRSSPNSLSTNERTRMTARFVARKRAMRFMENAPAGIGAPEV